MKRFSNKVVIITGAAQGIGREVALQMASEGARLILLDRSEIVEEVSRLALQRGAEAAEVLLGDLEKYRTCQKLVQQAYQFNQRIDILINNVGGTIWLKPYTEYIKSEIESELQRSLFPTLWCCHATLPFMQKQGAGTIVNVSSIATRGIYRAPYSAAKGGINALTIALAWENAKYGIRVNAIAPGGTDVGERRIPRNSNPMSEREKAWYQEVIDQTIDSTFVKRFSSVEEQALPVLFMASDESSYITGTILPVGGGDLG